ncbi:hypothetical protein ACFWVC_30120 [Streptomyces sp. NPDC058691]|uniref:hypothetical protein n=1 Tax=Streptomyces sp. NPDC058691 TaxID=3346601 RepID=UPI003656C5A1
MRGIRAAVAVLGLLASASAAVAGCGGPGTAGEPLAGPEPAPVASPGHGRAAGGVPAPPPASASPAAPAAPGVAVAPRRTPRAPARTRPAASPSPRGTTASPWPRHPDLSRTAAPSVSPRPRTAPTRPSSSPQPPTQPSSSAPSAPPPDGTTTLRIGTWTAQVVRGDQETVDACRDAVQWDGPDLGTENGYAMNTAVVVGHDYCGFQRFATLPIGTAVTATTPRGTFTYRVYAHHIEPGRGTPSHGLYWGDLTLQSCVGPNTGFSYLARE